MKLKILATLFSLVQVACTMDVKDAVAPTNPPKTEKSSFTVSQIEGHFVSGLPVAFLWPEFIFNEESQTMVPMTFSQKADSRTSIVRFSEENALYEAMALEEERLINEKYAKMNSELEATYFASQCHTLCDPEDFFCDPINSPAKFQDTWKPTEDPEELALIAECQQNEQLRKDVEPEKEKEIANKVTPLNEKAGVALLALSQAVGDENFIAGLAGLEIQYGPSQICDADNECITANPAPKALAIRVDFVQGSFSNIVDDEVLFPIENLEFDEVNGFITFSIPKVDFESDNRVYGQLWFSLELNPQGKSMVIGGDVRLINFDDGSDRIGRISAKGEITPWGESLH